MSAFKTRALATVLFMTASFTVMPSAAALAVSDVSATLSNVGSQNVLFENDITFSLSVNGGVAETSSGCDVFLQKVQGDFSLRLSWPQAEFSIQATDLYATTAQVTSTGLECNFEIRDLQNWNDYPLQGATFDSLPVTLDVFYKGVAISSAEGRFLKSGIEGALVITSPKRAQIVPGWTKIALSGGISGRAVELVEVRICPESCQDSRARYAQIYPETESQYSQGLFGYAMVGEPASIYAFFAETGLTEVSVKMTFQGNATAVASVSINVGEPSSVPWSIASRLFATALAPYLEIQPRLDCGDDLTLGQVNSCTIEIPHTLGVLTTVPVEITSSSNDKPFVKIASLNVLSGDVQTFKVSVPKTFKSFVLQAKVADENSTISVPDFLTYGPPPKLYKKLKVALSTSKQILLGETHKFFISTNPKINGTCTIYRHYVLSYKVATVKLKGGKASGTLRWLWSGSDASTPMSLRADCIGGKYGGQGYALVVGIR